VFRGLSYADAVTLLGGRSRTVATLDRLLGGVLLAAGAAGAPLALTLFDPKNELAALSNQLVGDGLARLRGLSRFDRTERLAAAHAVLVVSAYFETLPELPLPFRLDDARLSPADQLGLATGTRTADRLAATARALLKARIPMPTPECPFEEGVHAVRGFYRGLSGDLVTLLSGLAPWDDLDETARTDATRLLVEEAPDRAVRRYQEAFARLATQVPEVAFWAHRLDHRSTREAVREVSLGLERLERLVEELAGEGTPDARREALAHAYRQELVRPVLTSGDVPPGVCLPQLGEAYVSPDYRAAEVSSSEDLISERWWRAHAVRSDLEHFLAGYLTSARSTRSPLLVLGQPGSGKSVLTRVLAARLPAREFLVIRVVLRDVPADADLQTHIEHAIRAATGEQLSWPELARTGGGALPVVLLDGFDELLQATGVHQTDYLERVATFQQREQALGRPVAVLVTSRTAVADRARCTPGTVAIRLEPFRREHVEQWLVCWNGVNEAVFAERGLHPLPADAVLASADLASQPLLLMMLALYDSDGNALQQLGRGLTHAELYERLLWRFAAREVGKEHRQLPDEDFTHQVERELLRLSVVAFAMFNRRRQWVSEQELDRDLTALLGGPDRARSRAGLRADLTAGERALGRFFFVHRSGAHRDGQALHTFEFLHATFGEYLLARLVARELADLAREVAFRRHRQRAEEIDDAFLHALLSFAPLTMRATAVRSLRDLMAAWSPEQRALLREPLLDLFHQALQPRAADRFAGYLPRGLDATARPATYACNLLILLVALDGQVRGCELFAREEDLPFRWRRLALLWRARLPAESWAGLLGLLRVERTWSDGQRDVRVTFTDRAAGDQGQGPDPSPDLDLRWSYHEAVAGPAEPAGPCASGSLSWAVHSPEDIRGHSHFVCDRRVDVLAHLADPFADRFPEAVVTFHHSVEDGTRSAANSLVNLWLASALEEDPAALCRYYDGCLEFAEQAFGPSGEDERGRYLRMVLRQLAIDRPRLPESWLQDRVDRIRRLASGAW